MATCSYCGTTILFGGKRIDDLVFCNGIDRADWHSIGLDEKISVTQEFRTFEFKFRAHDVA